MEKCSIRLSVITNDESVFAMLFGGNDKREVLLGPGITVLHNATENGKINTSINITNESIKDYRPELGLNIVSNIVAAWLVFRLTGKPVFLEINEKKLPVKKTLIRMTLEQELKKCGFG